jgi:hypothetical protein
MGRSDYRRTAQHKAEQKARTEKNKLKQTKKRKFASEEVKARKLAAKEIKRQRYFRTHAKR